MRAVDTSVLVRLITRDDAKQVAASEAFISRGAWVSHLVLAEAMWVLGAAYGLERASIAKAVSMLLEHESLAVQEPDVVAAALEHYRSQRGVGFSDCLILEIARKAGHVPLGSFDKSLGKLPGAQRLGAQRS